MSAELKGRSLLTLEEFSTGEVEYLVEQALVLKREKAARTFRHHLADRNFCLIFLKPSTRTRASFFVAASDEGAQVANFDDKDLRFNSKESLEDIARVLGRMFDGIAFRGFEHHIVEDLARHAGVPVWNALSDAHHPTQVLADLMTLKEEFGRLAGLKLAYVGDGRNNMGASLMIAACKVGLDLRIVAPAPLQPKREAVAGYLEANPHTKARITVTADVSEGVRDCDAVYGDIWLSMGEEHLAAERIPMLQGYKIDDAMLAATHKPEAIFLHCLPSLHDDTTDFARKFPDVLDTSDELFEGPRSRVFQQAENRMHVIKALMIATV
ncbi:MAG TPA: ornithine carbamoyltransferase [Rhizomicrobium sp.]|jgi:ornithine carbamoyltransferase